MNEKEKSKNLGMAKISKIKCITCGLVIDIPQHFMTVEQAYEYASHHNLLTHKNFIVDWLD